MDSPRMEDNLRRNKRAPRLRHLVSPSRLLRQQRISDELPLARIRIHGPVPSSIRAMIIPSPAAPSNLPTGLAASARPRVVGAMRPQRYRMPFGERQTGSRATCRL